MNVSRTTSRLWPRGNPECAGCVFVREVGTAGVRKLGRRCRSRVGGNEAASCCRTLIGRRRRHSWRRRPLVAKVQLKLSALPLDFGSQAWLPRALPGIVDHIAVLTAFAAGFDHDAGCAEHSDLTCHAVVAIRSAPVRRV